MSVLDYPIRVDEQAERIYFCNGRVSVDMNGDERERKDVLRLLAQIPQLINDLCLVASADTLLKSERKAIQDHLRTAGVLP